MFKLSSGGAAALTLSSLGLAAAGMVKAGMIEAPPPRAEQRAQVTVRNRLVIRVPVRPRGIPMQSQWREERGPKCLPSGSIAGAALAGRDSVDLILRDNSRVRAKLEDSCPALDYYFGFYINPTQDGQICADRDVIRSRMGGQCEIDRFRRLVPRPRKAP